MKLLVTVFLLFTFCCYSLLGDNLTSHNNSSYVHNNTSITKRTSPKCCSATPTHETEDYHCSHNEEESDDSCKKTCCDDYCCCVKVLKTPFLKVSQHQFSFYNRTKTYVDLYLFSFQHYTFSIFKPPKDIA